MNQHQLHQQLQQQLQHINNNCIAPPSQSNSSSSPKKTIILQKYNEDLDDMVIKTYTTRLVLTWIYNNPTPPILSPLPKLKVIPGSTSSKQFSNQTLHTSTHTFIEIESYVKEVFDLWETVLSFFYSQHIKRSKAYYQNVKQSPSNIESDQSVKLTLKSIIIASIYYSDLFFRKSCNNNNNKQQSLTILDIIISSINLSIKMWLEEKMSVNKYLSEIFGVSLVHVNSLERYFLTLIDYQLYLHEKDIQSFANIIHKSYVNKSQQQQKQQQQHQQKSQIQSSCSNNNNNSKSIENNENNHNNNHNNKISIQVYSNNNYHGNDSVNSSPLPCSVGGASHNANYNNNHHHYGGESSNSSPSVLVVPSSPIKSFASASSSSPSTISPKKRYLSISRSSCSISTSSSSTNTPITTSSSPSTTVPYNDDYQDQPRKKIKAILA